MVLRNSITEKQGKNILKKHAHSIMKWLRQKNDSLNSVFSVELLANGDLYIMP